MAPLIEYDKFNKNKSEKGDYYMCLWMCGQLSIPSVDKFKIQNLSTDSISVLTCPQIHKLYYYIYYFL